MVDGPIPVQQRPFVMGRFTIAQLLPTQRTDRIPASSWEETLAALLALGDDPNEPVEYKRQIGGYLLWRAGPPVGEARYMASRIDDISCQFRFRLHGKRGSGVGPDGNTHERYRSWKESLLEDS